MDFELSDEQRMLADSLRRHLEGEYGFEHRRRTAREGGGFGRETWRVLADMGVLGLTIDPQFGGFGEGAASQLVVQHELGRALLLEPVTASAVIATAMLQAHASQALKAEWLPAMGKGERILTLAYLEEGCRHGDDTITTHARRHPEGYVVSGRKTLAWHVEAADAVLVTARIEGEDAVTMFLVPKTSEGLQIVGYPTLDGMRAGDVLLGEVIVPPHHCIGGEGNGGEVLQHGLDHGIAALCAEAGGAMERLIELTSEYLCTRQQFGRPLGSFQALQHRMADMLVQKELALSMAYVAAQALDEPDTRHRTRMLSAAKFMTAKAARFIGQQAVQLHGGMGMTDELLVGDYFKRLTMIDPMFGDSDYQLSRYCAVLDGHAW